MGFGLVLGDLEEGLREQGFAQDWVLSGSRGISVSKSVISHVYGKGSQSRLTCSW